MTNEEENRLYQLLGQFIVSFQWIEHRIREIGWFCDDPNRNIWPPTILRKESNYELIQNVKQLFFCYMDKHCHDDIAERKNRFETLMDDCHGVRRYRNNLLHSAFIELKAADGDINIMRVNPVIEMDSVSGQYVFDREILREEAILNKMRRLSQIALELNLHYSQLIHLSIN